MAAVGTTVLDWVLAEVPMKGNCTKTDCKVHVSLTGFGALNPVDVCLVGLGIPDSAQHLGALAADRSGAARGAIRFEKPTAAGEYDVSHATATTTPTSG